MVAIVPGALVSRREGNSSEAREMGGRQRLDQAGPCRLWQGIGCYSQKRGIHGIQSLEPGRDGSGYGGGGAGAPQRLEWKPRLAAGGRTGRRWALVRLETVGTDSGKHPVEQESQALGILVLAPLPPF